MELEGVVQNGVIVVACPRPLPEGTKVKLHLPDEAVAQVAANGPVEPVRPGLTLQERLLQLAGTVEDLPPDMARQHDHYIHGAPKQ